MTQVCVQQSKVKHNLFESKMYKMSIFEALKAK